MTTYSLNIEIDPKGLHAIYAANQYVTLVKSVGSSPGNVAWISFQPFGSNTVTVLRRQCASRTGAGRHRRDAGT